jgi:hypothetical protein
MPSDGSWALTYPTPGMNGFNSRSSSVFQSLFRAAVVRQTTVKLDEFVRYCRKIGASSDLQTLRDFAAAKHAGEHY